MNNFNAIKSRASQDDVQLFIPTTNMWGWWNAQNAYTDAGKTTLCSVSGSDTCYTAADLSGNGRDLIQATGASRPTWYSGQLNDLPCLRFDGSNDFLARATDTINADWGFFLVFKNITWTSGKVICGRHDIPSTGDLQQDDTTPQVRLVGPSINNGNLAVSQWGLVHAAYNTTDCFTRINRSEAIHGTFTPLTPVGFDLGAYTNGTSPSNIDVAEFILYHGVTITDGSDVQTQVTRYFQNKYRLGIVI